MKNHSFAVQDITEYKLLDDLAIKANTDKSSLYHNYTEIYANYFGPIKDKPIKFLEIGIKNGYSANLWEMYFPNAELHFMDISLELVEYHSEQCQYYVADQSNPQDLERFIQNVGGDFDIILDDGGHTTTQQVTSFISLFPHVKSGGLYIIEDLHTAYWKNYGGDYSRKTTIGFLKDLIDDVNFIGARTTKASHLDIDPVIRSEMTEYQEKIYSIHFYDSIAIIRKR